MAPYAVKCWHIRLGASAMGVGFTEQVGAKQAVAQGSLSIVGGKAIHGDLADNARKEGGEGVKIMKDLYSVTAWTLCQ